MSVCSRCKRPAPVELDGEGEGLNAEVGAWVLVGAPDDENGIKPDVLICPSCLTRPEALERQRDLGGEAAGQK